LTDLNQKKKEFRAKVRDDEGRSDGNRYRKVAAQIQGNENETFLMMILARLRVAGDHLGLEPIDEIVSRLREVLHIAEFVAAKERREKYQRDGRYS
jgi:hypothetical protein